MPLHGVPLQLAQREVAQDSIISAVSRGFWHHTITAGWDAERSAWQNICSPSHLRHCFSTIGYVAKWCYQWFKHVKFKHVSASSTTGSPGAPGASLAHAAVEQWSMKSLALAKPTCVGNKSMLCAASCCVQCLAMA
jgi:poly-gamma-glutamate capsule biosynthesis protein CapA/YwtB (metallophosphatase superfamily)